MSKIDNRSDFLEENEIQPNEDQFIDSDIMEQMIQETFDMVEEDAFPFSSKKQFTFPVKILIGTAQVSNETMQQYSAEDLIVLDQSASSPVTLTTQEGQTFKGKLGQLKNHYALRLLKP